MSYNNDPILKVINKLNESTQKVPFAETEQTVFVDGPQDVHQCPDCSGVYHGNVSSCPICGAPVSDTKNESKTSKKRRIRECDEPVFTNLNEDDDDFVDENPELDNIQNDEDESTSEIDDSEKNESDCEDNTPNTGVIEEDDDLEYLPDDIKNQVNEAMRLLTKGNTKRFNESYGNSRRLSGSRINLLLESRITGCVHSVVRKMTPIQAATFRMTESTKKVTVTKKSSTKRMTEARISCNTLLTMTEMRRVKVKALSLVERIGNLTPAQVRKIRESLEDEISNNENNIETKLEAIESDTTPVDFTEDSPEEVASTVIDTVKNTTGLDVVSNETDVDSADTATISLRVQDDPSTEVNLQDVADTLEDVMGTPVAVVGPEPVEGDGSLADMTVVVNPDDSITETETDEDEVEQKVALSESLRKRSLRRLSESRRIYESDCDEDDCDDPDCDEDDVKNESRKRRSSRRR